MQVFKITHLIFSGCRKHVVFGKVVEGMDVLNKIEQQPTGERDRPELTIKISSCGEISRGGKSNGTADNGVFCCLTYSNIFIQMEPCCV